MLQVSYQHTVRARTSNFRHSRQVALDLRRILALLAKERLERFLDEKRLCVAPQRTTVLTLNVSRFGTHSQMPPRFYKDTFEFQKHRRKVIGSVCSSNLKCFSCYIKLPSRVSLSLSLPAVRVQHTCAHTAVAVSPRRIGASDSSSSGQNFLLVD